MRRTLLNDLAHAIEGRSLQFEMRLRIRGESGRLRTVDGVLCIDYVAEPPEVIGYLTDITRVIESEAELAAHEEVLESVIDQSPDAILLLDEHGVVRSVSSGFARMLGLRQNAAWTGEHAMSLMRPWPACSPAVRARPCRVDVT